MTRARRAKETTKLLAGGAGLFAGLELLRKAPLAAVLVTLCAMSFVLISAARLGGVEVRHAGPKRASRTRNEGEHEI